MGFAWSHTTYALWNGIIFNFEDKWDLDYFLAHAEGSCKLSANEAWKTKKDFVKVFSSRSLGSNKDRANKVKEFKNDRTSEAR